MPHRSPLPEFQRQFAALCRSGKYSPLPGLTERRAGTYHGLVHSIIDDALRRAYPITLMALGDSEWSDLVGRFLTEWPLGSPQLWKMPRQLVEFVEQSGYGELCGRPYLVDLLKFEWIEIEVQMMEDLPAQACRNGGELEQDRLVINREFKVLKLDFPVYKAPLNGIESQRSEYLLLAFRHPKSLRTEYLELSPLLLQIVEALALQPLSVQEAVDIASGGMEFEHAEILVPDFLRSLAECGMITGYLDPAGD